MEYYLLAGNLDSQIVAKTEKGKPIEIQELQDFVCKKVIGEVFIPSRELYSQSK